MKSHLLLTALLALLMILAACASAPGETLIPMKTAIIPETGGTEMVPTPETGTPKAVAATHTPAPTETIPASITPTSGVGSQITLMVNRTEASPFLVDQQGRSLYIYMYDSQNSNTSACMDDCAVEWPPVSVSGMPAAGEGVDANLISTLSRDDGLTQATYNGWPLYYYNMDSIPGTTYGQRYNGVWFLISPSGDPIQR